MFDKLNKEKIKYIILRDKLNSNDDIDLLCNDYFLKTVDAQSFKHKNLQLYLILVIPPRIMVLKYQILFV